MAVTNTVADQNPVVFGGVDTHKDIHVAAALDGVGRLLGTKAFATTPSGYRNLLNWFESFGSIEIIGIEGTGSWGKGLSCYLRDKDIKVIEVPGPNRQRRRRLGKSDTTDAEGAARMVLAGEAKALPKLANGPVESIRILRAVRRSAKQSRTQTANQIHSLIDTAPSNLREDLRGLSVAAVCKKMSRCRPADNLGDPATSTKFALRSLAQRWLQLNEEIKALDVQLVPLIQIAAPEAFLDAFGVGPDTAGALLVAVGDDPLRCQSEAGFAALCGVSPMESSSGRRNRHRLNRGGNREANSALWMIVIVRLRYDPETQAYMARRLTEGKTKREVIRCLKRSVARQLWRKMRPVVQIEEELPKAA